MRMDVLRMMRMYYRQLVVGDNKNKFTGTGSCFGISGEDKAETIRAVQSSIPGCVEGDAVDDSNVGGVM